MTSVIPLTETYKGLHPTSGKEVTVVGIDASGYSPRLIIIRNDAAGIQAEVVDYVDARRGA